jgi:hypothetical protein
LPVPQHDAQAALLGRYVYVFGGGQSSSYDHILRYDPVSGTVINAGTLPSAASDVGVTEIGSTAYVVGGFNGTTSLDTILAWRPGEKPRAVGRLPSGLRYAAVAASGGRLIIAGGTTPSGMSNSILSFDPASGSVSRIGQLPFALTHSSAAPADGRVLIIGGRRQLTGARTDAILAINPATGRVRQVGALPQALSDAAVASSGAHITVAGGENTGGTSGTVLSLAPHLVTVRPALARTSSRVDPVLLRLGLPPLHGSSPLPSYLMIADRDNNRIIVVNPSKRIVWRFPGHGSLRPGQQFAGPDDAFISADRKDIITNEEFSDTIASLSLTRHPHIVWEYGHQDVQGNSPGFLAHPDDAYQLSNGDIQVADIINCRVLWLDHNHQIVRRIGTSGDCTHDPPRALLQPNGDTPLPDGGVLVTEIGGWIDRFSARGKLVWSIRAPSNYPSDAQLLSDGNVLVAGFDTPGRIDILTPRGRIIWTYGPQSGPGALDRPSLAVELPNGKIAATDDWHHRVVVIDPATKRIVWQYGHNGVAGSGTGFLSKPDGLDLLP